MPCNAPASIMGLGCRQQDKSWEGILVDKSQRWPCTSRDNPLHAAVAYDSQNVERHCTSRDSLHTNVPYDSQRVERGRSYRVLQPHMRLGKERCFKGRGELHGMSFVPVEDPVEGLSYMLCSFCRCDRLFQHSHQLLKHLSSGSCPDGHRALLRAQENENGAGISQNADISTCTSAASGAASSSAPVSAVVQASAGSERWCSAAEALRNAFHKAGCPGSWNAAQPDEQPQIQGFSVTPKVGSQRLMEALGRLGQAWRWQLRLDVAALVAEQTLPPPKASRATSSTATTGTCSEPEALPSLEQIFSGGSPSAAKLPFAREACFSEFLRRDRGELHDLVSSDDEAIEVVAAQACRRAGQRAPANRRCPPLDAADGCDQNSKSMPLQRCMKSRPPASPPASRRQRRA